jgi:hypothetical protein
MIFNPRRARRLLAALVALVAVAAAVALTAGCGAATQQSPAPRPQDWRAVMAYLHTHPVHLAQGRTAGILVSTAISSYACLNGTCRTWSGTVVERNGQTVQVSSQDGDSGMAIVLYPGDYFAFWPGDGTVDQPGDVWVIRHGAVPVGAG